MPARPANKRLTDQTIIGGWIEARQRVLDVGCGRGLLLEHLAQTREIYGVGVDNDLEKVKNCVKRGVSVYMGDAEEFMRALPEHAFDWVILSRTLQELDQPGRVIDECLRVGKRVAIGFVNYGYWRNRLEILVKSRHARSPVHPLTWAEDVRHNPVTVEEFERFCVERGLLVRQRVFLRGDWRTPCDWLPSWFAGYALYWIERP